MCGRYCISGEIVNELEQLIPNMDRNLQLYHTIGEIAPSQTATVLHNKNGTLGAGDMIWGFPGRDGKGLLINARAETLLERPTFKESALYRRCIIPAQAFLEWNRNKEKGTFTRPDTSVLYMAGVFNTFRDETRFVIITTQANESVSPTHHRMPVILEPSELEDWVLNKDIIPFILNKVPNPLLAQFRYHQQNIFEILNLE